MISLEDLFGLSKGSASNQKTVDGLDLITADPGTETSAVNLQVGINTQLIADDVDSASIADQIGQILEKAGISSNPTDVIQNGADTYFNAYLTKNEAELLAKTSPVKSFEIVKSADINESYSVEISP